MARRLSPEQLQENKSRGQFKAFISDCGWIVEDVQEDLGEDLIVRIFDNGESSGLSFYVQLKSVSNKTGWKDTDPYFTYPATGVSDLEHWSSSTIIVVFCVWNVDTNSGVWLTVPQAIKELDSNRQGWRNQKTASIHIPLSNNTTENGIKELRVRIAEYNVPLAMGEAPLYVKTNLAFPNTEEGKKAEEEFNKMLETGSPVKIDSGFVNSVTLPDWFYRIFGNDLTKHQGAIFIGPSPHKRMTPLRLDMLCDDGQISSLQYIQTYIKQSGSQQITITNERQTYPINISIIISEPKEGDKIGNVAFSMSIKNEWKSAFEIKEVTDFICLAKKGGILRIVFYDDGHCVNNRINPGSIGIEENGMNELAEMLCYIEAKLGITIPKTEQQDITSSDAAAINLVYSTLEKGTRHSIYKIEKEISFNEALGLLNQSSVNGNLTFINDFKNTEVNIIGTKINLGRRISHISFHTANLDELKDFVVKNESEKKFLLKVEKAEAIEVFPQWSFSPAGIAHP